MRQYQITFIIVYESLQHRLIQKYNIRRIIDFYVEWFLVIYEKRLINSGLIWWTNHKLYKHIKVGADDDHLNTSHAINISISIQNIVTCLMHIKSVTIGNYWRSSSLKVHVFIINEHMPTPNCSSILSSVSLNINLHILSHWTNARFDLSFE